MQKIYLVQKLEMDALVCAVKKMISDLHNPGMIKEAQHFPGMQY